MITSVSAFVFCGLLLLVESSSETVTAAPEGIGHFFCRVERHPNVVRRECQRLECARGVSEEPVYQLAADLGLGDVNEILSEC